MKDLTNINSTIEDIFYLASCALNSEEPDITRIRQMDGEKVFELARYHNIESMLFHSFKLCDLGITLKDKATGNDIDIMARNFEMSTELIRIWNEAHKKATIKNVQLDTGRQALYEAMETVGCWYVPLKGIILKEMYPADSMRQMSDNDILFNEHFRDWVHEWFEKQGYKTEVFDTGCEDVYIIAPYRVYEMHVSLVGSNESAWFDYYKDVEQRFIKTNDPRDIDKSRPKNAQFGYCFSDEDFYIFMMLHAYKHYRGAGTGIRVFFDTYVYLNNKKDSLDWEYIHNECEKLEIAEFEQIIRQLTFKTLKSDLSWTTSLSESERKTLYYIIGSGTYGTTENRVNNGIDKHSKGQVTLLGKIKFLFSRIFLPKKIMYLQNPLCRRHHWMLPVFYVLRIFKGLLQKRIYDEVGRVVKRK